MKDKTETGTQRQDKNMQRKQKYICDMTKKCILACRAQMEYLSIGEQSVSKMSVRKAFT